MNNRDHLRTTSARSQFRLELGWHQFSASSRRARHTPCSIADISSKQNYYLPTKTIGGLLGSNFSKDNGMCVERVMSNELHSSMTSNCLQSRGKLWDAPPASWTGRGVVSGIHLPLPEATTSILFGGDQVFVILSLTTTMLFGYHIVRNILC